MDTPVLELIHRHASVRHYRPDPVPDSLLERIVAAAQRAPTSSNLQTYSVIVVTDAGRRERLAELCGDQRHIREAPVFLAWCADRARLDHVCALRGYTQVTDYLEDFLVAALDAVLAAQNAVLAAESLGLGTCYIGGIRNRPLEVIELLALPRLVFPVVGMTLGWPSRPPRTRPRLPLEAILHRERYNPDQDAALQAYDKVMIETGIYKGRRVPSPKGEGEEPYGWLEHSARRASRPVRTDLSAALRRQGFGLK